MKIKLGSRSSARWSVLRRMVLRRADGVAYLDRIRIVQTPLFGVFLHRMDAPDPGIDLHDHPWPFVTVVLRGGYHEYRTDTRLAGMYADVAERFPSQYPPGIAEHRRKLRPRLLRLGECHSIYAIDRTPTWTLVFVGRRTRKWGFYVPQSASLGHFVRYDEYEQLGRRELTYQEDS